MGSDAGTGRAGAAWLAPGKWLGVMGGGQLGRMFATAAQSMGYRVCVLDPDVDSPAGRIADRHLCAGYLDAQALAEMGALCDAVTTEFENVPAEALATLARYGRVTPRSEAVAIAQDRIAEKEFIAACGVATAPFAAVHDVADLHAVEARGPGVAELFPGILKVVGVAFERHVHKAGIRDRGLDTDDEAHEVRVAGGRERGGGFEERHSLVADCCVDQDRADRHGRVLRSCPETVTAVGGQR